MRTHPERAAALAATIMMAACLAVAAEDQTPASGQSEPAPAQERKAEPQSESAQPDQSTAATTESPAPDRPQGTLKQTAWYLMGYENDKVGYLNRALYALDDDPSGAAYRIETRRFMRSSLAEDRPDYFEESFMWLDASFGALRFRTTRRTGAEPQLKIEGTVADGRLSVEAVCGDQKRSWTAGVEGNPTFAGALLLWVGSHEMSDNATWARSFVNERNGTPQNKETRFRVVQKASLNFDNRKETAWLVSEENGLVRTLHIFRAGGRLYRSQGQNHNQTSEEIPGTEAAGLKLDGTLEWQNAVPLKVGDGLSSEAFGYKLTLPSYPYAPIVFSDGGILLAGNTLGDDRLIVLANPIRSGDEQAAERIYRWAALFGISGEPTRGQMTIDGLPARTYSVKTTLLGLDVDCRFVTVARDDVGYLLGHIAPWPAKADDRDVFGRLLSSVRWTRVFGREHGTWDGRRYESLSHGYRVELPSDGWRLPQQRRGVPTDIEAAREDGAAVMTLTVQQAQPGITAEAVAANYRKNIEQNMSGATDVSQKACTLNNRPAVEISYDAKAIDDEPTRTRHVIAVSDNHWYLLTLVSKKSVLESAGARFDRMLESFEFGGDRESPATDN
ncbi:MAG: hypothetical protein JXL80_16085 [Planctomycetes bacterium]|nr:hypothetical protein [Planctomycetota bacterium]